MNTFKLAILVVLDGWGIAEPYKGNAITSTKTPTYSSLLTDFPNSVLQASGTSVGLPPGEFGNSETGHYNLGAGYIVPQDVVRIDQAIKDGSFFRNKAALDVCQHVSNNQSALHLMGLLSEAKVHSSIDHLLALLQLAKQQNLNKVYLHLFTDGRDSPPTSSQTALKRVTDYIKKLGVGQVASIIGRFYAMDRDERWLRTQQAYNLLTLGEGHKSRNAFKAISEAYKRKETDEFISATVIDSPQKKFAPILDNDGIIFFNFRSDRPRQLTSAFVNENFDAFKRKKSLKNLFFVTMTPYADRLPVSGVIFEHIFVDDPLAKVISDHGLQQLHLAESEKFPHVTYFFNGGRETPHEGEDWIEVPSPKVTTYDQKPEMSAHEVTEIFIERIKSNKYNFILVNYANPDMVAHTGNFKAAQKAIAVLDKCLERIVSIVLEQDALLLLTADHGNIERMIDPNTEAIDTQHNLSPVPCIAVATQFRKNAQVKLRNGVLADIAPTILAALGIPKPNAMTRNSLIQRSSNKKITTPIEADDQKMLE